MISACKIKVHPYARTMWGEQSVHIYDKNIKSSTHSDYKSTNLFSIVTALSLCTLLFLFFHFRHYINLTHAFIVNTLIYVYIIIQNSQRPLTYIYISLCTEYSNISYNFLITKRFAWVNCCACKLVSCPIKPIAMKFQPQILENAPQCSFIML